MDVILLENVRNLGKMGDIVKVKDGYGRNFLLKNGKALRGGLLKALVYYKTYIQPTHINKNKM